MNTREGFSSTEMIASRPPEELTPRERLASPLTEPRPPTPSAGDPLSALPSGGLPRGSPRAEPEEGFLPALPTCRPWDVVSPSPWLSFRPETTPNGPHRQGWWPGGRRRPLSPQLRSCHRGASSSCRNRRGLPFPSSALTVRMRPSHSAAAGFRTPGFHRGLSTPPPSLTPAPGPRSRTSLPALRPGSSDTRPG